ncbi:MAG TPA: response regulator transcription factor [Opitutaceae bacterium]|jgi:DNA-binding response OmpR family regulator
MTDSQTRPSPKPLIVVVEDEPDLASLVAQHLEKADMRVQVCNRAAHALKFLKKNFANLVLMDLVLPDQGGFELHEELKANNINVPVIFLTANIEEESKVHGLEQGGDDYITKPFSYAELTARIKAVLRRADYKEDLNLTKNVKVNTEPFDFCGARIMPERLEVEFPGGELITIGRKELGILSYLNEHQGKVITRKALIHAVWGQHADVRSRSLDQYVVKVRDLFKKKGLDLADFRTVHGIGYIFDPKQVARESS